MSIVLGLLELTATSSCGYGLSVLASDKNASILRMFYGSIWFVFGIFSNVCGLIALYMMRYGIEDEMTSDSQYWVQYHYLLAWMTIVIGYPAFLVQVYLTHHPSPYAHLFVILTLIPVGFWINKKARPIVVSTQVIAVVAIAAHLFISFKASQTFGIIGAGLMCMNVFALSVPTKYNIMGFSSREFYVVGLAITSIIFAMAVSAAAKNPVIVSNLF